MDYDDVEMRSSSEGGLSVGKERHSQISDHEEAGKSLLWTEDDDARISRTKSYAKRVPSLRFHIWATAINLLFFAISSAMMWISLRGNKMTLQDAWRATSFYCK